MHKGLVKICTSCDKRIRSRITKSIEDVISQERSLSCDTSHFKRLVKDTHGGPPFHKNVWCDTTVVASPWPTPGKVTKLATKATMNCHERGKYK